jgi:hypothetical protein
LRIERYNSIDIERTNPYPKIEISSNLIGLGRLDQPSKSGLIVFPQNSLGRQILVNF